MSAGIKTGIVSTINAKIGNREYDTGLHVTNSEPFQLQKILRKMVTANCKYVVLEVTSHGLYQHRNWGINFDVGVLTNITHEHLDYHKTFENYVRAKEKLFKNSKVAILNKKYAKLIKSNGKRIMYDVKNLDNDLRDAILKRFKEPYNLENATAAIMVSKILKIPNKHIIKAIKTFPGIKGRMEEIKNDRNIKIIIDFAHTPNALKSLLTSLKNQKPENSKLIAVFGCAGERDVKKRPMMAKISTEIADISIFTTEDPRGEKVKDIISQMENGVKDKRAKVYKIEDRAKAISFAINQIAKKGDIIAICGKGHEKSMNFKGIEIPWSDKSKVLKILTSVR